MYGIVFVASIDGASAFITSYSTMSRKTIHTVEAYGLFEQIIVDGGREFYLTLFGQHYLSAYRNSQRQPFKQVKSTKNNRIERWWVEQNRRVGYPIKYCLLDVELRELVHRTIPHHLFSISEVAKRVAHYGMSLAVNSWNCHTIPSEGKPMQYLSTSRTARLGDGVVLSPEDAVRLYEADGGLLTQESVAGDDLLINRNDLKILRNEQFETQILQAIAIEPIAKLFSATVNYDYTLLQYVVSRHIHLSEFLFNNQ